MKELDKLRDVLDKVSDNASSAYSDIDEMIELLEALIPSSAKEAYRYADGILQGVRLAQFLVCSNRIGLETALINLLEELDANGEV